MENSQLEMLLRTTVSTILSNKIVSQLYEEGEKLFENPLVKVQEQYSKLEVVINLPFEMLIEQVELVM